MLDLIKKKFLAFPRLCQNSKFRWHKANFRLFPDLKKMFSPDFSLTMATFALELSRRRAQGPGKL